MEINYFLYLNFDISGDFACQEESFPNLGKNSLMYQAYENQNKFKMLEFAQ